MCIVSVVTTGAHTQLPPVNQWPVQDVLAMQRVIALLESIDKRLGAKDCQDEVKDKFLQELADRVRSLETKAAQTL